MWAKLSGETAGLAPWPSPGGPFVSGPAAWPHPAAVSGSLAVSPSYLTGPLILPLFPPVLALLHIVCLPFPRHPPNLSPQTCLPAGFTALVNAEVLLGGPLTSSIFPTLFPTVPLSRGPRIGVTVARTVRRGIQNFPF